VLDGSGTAHALDATNGSLVYRTIRRGGVPGSPQTLATNVVFGGEGSYPAQFAIDAGGQLHVLWNGAAPNPACGSAIITCYYATLNSSETPAPILSRR
jgi:hypothetical protein